MSNLNPADPAQNTNQRSPPLTLPSVAAVGNSASPYIRFSQYRDGSWCRADEYPNNSSYSRGHISGTFMEHTALSGTQEFVVNTHHHYVGGGKTTTSDQNHDNKLGGSHVDRITSDRYAEHGGDQMHAIGGDVIHAVGGILFQHATNGTQVTSTGDHVSDHNDGSHYVNVANDHIQYNQGVKYTYVGSESGYYVPNGNHDTNVRGKTNFTSGQQITLQVGSTIITINGSSVIIHDGTGNEMGLDGNEHKMWIGNPSNPNYQVYLGGNGHNAGLYAPIATMAGPSVNVQAKYIDSPD